MELKEFVQRTLLEVAEGIQLAQEHDEVGGQIAPSKIGGHDFSPESGVYYKARILSTVVKFDVAVTSSTTVSTKAGGKGRILVAEASAELNGDLTNSKVSRVQFSVPFVFAPNKNKWHE